MVNGDCRGNCFRLKSRYEIYGIHLRLMCPVGISVAHHSGPTDPEFVADAQ
jgi:hypothetical protein